MRVPLISVASLALGLTAALGVTAAMAGEAVPCRYDTKVNPAAIVAACTPVIGASDTGREALADALVARGRALTVLGDYKRALADFDAALKIEPDNADAHAGRGLALLMSGKPGPAIQALTRAITIDPKITRAFIVRGRAFRQLGADDLALGDFDAAIAVDPTSSVAYLERGGILAQRKEFEAAIVSFDKGIALDPNSALGYAGRGIARQAAGQFERAFEDFDKAVQLAPTDPHAFHQRGLAYLKAKKLDRAVADFDKALALDPHFEVAAKARAAAVEASNPPDPATEVRSAASFAAEGAALRKKRLYTEAIAAYDRAIALDPENAAYRDSQAVIYSMRGAVSASKGDFVAAEKDTTAALERTVDPSFAAELYFARGQIRIMTRDYSAAIDDFDQALARKPRHDPSYALRGEARIRARDGNWLADFGLAFIPPPFSDWLADNAYQLALADLDKAIALNGGYAHSWYFRGVARVRLGDPKAALADFNRAIDLAPRIAQPFVGRAGAYVAMRDFDSALADLDRATAIDPRSAEAYFERGRVHVATGDYAKAVQDFDAVLRIDPGRRDARLARQAAMALQLRAPVGVPDAARKTDREL